MKRSIYTVLICAAVLLFNACEENKPDGGVNNEQEQPGNENEKPEEDIFSFEVYDLHSSHCKVKVTPADMESPYFCGVATQTYLETFGSLDDMHVTATNFIETIILENMETPVSELMKKGVHEREVTGLQPEQTFIVFACHTNEMGEIVSEVEMIKTVTPAVEASENNFEIEIDQITATSALLFITPSNDDDYIWLEFPEDVYNVKGKEMSEEELKKLLVNYKSFFPLHTNNGEMVHSFDDKLEPDTEYMIIVFGYDGDFTTPLTTKKFRTLEPGDTTDVTFKFEYAELSARSVSVTVKPSDKSVPYLTLVIDEATMARKGEPNAETVKKIIDNEINIAIKFGEFSDRAAFVQDVCQYGEKTGYFGLEPGMKHYTCAVCMDKEGNYTSEVAIDEFMAPEEISTTAAVNAVFDKYFDGDEVAATDNDKYGDCAGYAVLPVSFELTGGALDGIYTVFTREEIEEAEPTDDQLRSILLNDDYLNVTNFFTSTREDIILDWDCDYVLCMIGIDAGENVGKLVKMDIPALTKAGASPISEFTPGL